tara:strand:- start:224 stop:841 length:618 start_codon:yes stop_codon:yes gene_type:complete
MNYSILPITPYNFGLELGKPSKDDFDDQIGGVELAFKEALQTYQLQTGEKPLPKWVKFSEREPEGEFYVRREYEIPLTIKYSHTQHGYLTFSKDSYKGEEWADVAEHEKDLAIWYAGQKIYEGFEPTGVSGEFEMFLPETEGKYFRVAVSQSDFYMGIIDKHLEAEDDFGTYSPPFEYSQLGSPTHSQFQTLCEWWGIENKIREI